MKRLQGILVLSVILLSLLAGGIKGDGAPVTVLEGYSGLRENRQLAYIDVDENSERMHLFLSIASLNPGESLTVLIPLRTHPSDIHLEKMNSSEYMGKYGFSEISGLYDKQMNGTKKFHKDFGDMAIPISIAEIWGIFGLTALYSTSNMYSGGVAIYEHYETHGLSVDVYSFNSSDSLYQFYRSRHLTVPENVEETIERYGNFSVAVVNTVTKPPIPEDEFNALERYVPDVMDDFRDFVGTHDKIEVIGDYNFIDPELNEMMDKTFNKAYELNSPLPLYKYFRDLVFATYGLGDAEGFEISMSLPLYEGKVFFPLGTSPAWGKVGVTQIMFSCDLSHSLRFERPMKEVFYNGKHYYFWKAENSDPDYDLEGEMISEDNSWKSFTMSMNGLLYDLSPVLSFLIYLSAIALLWMPLEYYIERKEMKEKFTRKHVPRLVAISYMLSFLSMVLSFWITLILLTLRNMPKKEVIAEGVSVKRVSLEPEFQYGAYLLPLALFLSMIFASFSVIFMIYALLPVSIILYFILMFVSYMLILRGLGNIEGTELHDNIETEKFGVLWITGATLSFVSIFIYPLMLMTPEIFSSYVCGWALFLFVLGIMPLVIAVLLFQNIFRIYREYEK